MLPVLFEIPTPWGPVPVYSYGVMLGLSLLAAWYFIMIMGVRKERLDQDLMATCFIVTAVAGLVAARALYVLTNLQRFDTLGEWFAFRQGGMVAYGGFLGGFLASWAYMRVKRVPVMAWADLVAPVLGAGLALTRVGCWLYGCDFGKPLGDGAPGWLKQLGTFPRWTDQGEALSGSPAWSYHVREYNLGIDSTASMPIHPTQLYSALAGIALFVLGVVVLRRRQFRGQVLLVMTLAYAVWRFFIEYLRDDPQRGSAFGFTTSQLISLALIPVAIFAWVHLRRRIREHGEPPIPASAQIAETREPPTSASKSSKSKSSGRT